MYISLPALEFSEKRNKENTGKPVKGYIQIAGGAYIAQQSARSGLPRSLGVRLESHSTSRQAAKNILKNGLDPNRWGEKAGAAFNLLPKELVEEKVLASKGRAFITGGRDGRTSSNPLLKGLGTVYDRYRISRLRRDYRAGSILGKADWENVGRMNARLFQAQQKGPGAYLKEIESIKKDKSFAKVIQKQQQALLPGASLRGRSLYVGGSDSFFKKNFTVDPDLTLLAMATNKRLKLQGSRLAATKAAIQREGLGKLVKANKGRAAAGAGILAAGGIASTALVKTGVNELRGRPKKLTEKHKRNISKALKGKKRN